MSYSIGPDYVSLKIMKHSIDITAKHVSEMINEMFVSGDFPNGLKDAKICPGCAKTFSNYRPISILNAFLKMYEKAIYVRLSEFLDVNKLLSNCQFGIRCSYSPC
jgi:hypothetical protein